MPENRDDTRFTKTGEKINPCEENDELVVNFAKNG